MKDDLSGNDNIRPLTEELRRTATRFHHVEIMLLVSALLAVALIAGFGTYSTIGLRALTEDLERNQRTLEETQRELANNIRCQAEFFASRDATALQVERQDPNPRTLLATCFRDPPPPTPHGPNRP